MCGTKGQYFQAARAGCSPDTGGDIQGSPPAWLLQTSPETQSEDPTCRSGGRVEGEDAAQHLCQDQRSLIASPGPGVRWGGPLRTLCCAGQGRRLLCKVMGGRVASASFPYSAILTESPLNMHFFIIILFLKIVVKHTCKVPIRAL